MIGHMRHMGNSGKIAIAAFLAAVALLVLTVVTLHEAVLMWFLAASATAYIACVAEVIVRRRHKTLVASGVGTILCVAFGIAFMRQWGLAFNPDPAALTAPVTTNHPDLYFYLAAGAGAGTLLLLFAGTVLPGRRGQAAASASRRPASAPRPVTREAPSPRTTSASQRSAAARASGNRVPARVPAANVSAGRAAAGRTSAPSSSGERFRP